jgi:hypothetical protein
MNGWMITSSQRIPSVVTLLAEYSKCADPTNNSGKHGNHSNQDNHVKELALEIPHDLGSQGNHIKGVDNDEKCSLESPHQLLPYEDTDVRLYMK